MRCKVGGPCLQKADSQERTLAQRERPNNPSITATVSCHQSTTQAQKLEDNHHLFGNSFRSLNFEAPMRREVSLLIQAGSNMAMKVVVHASVYHPDQKLWPKDSSLAPVSSIQIELNGSH